MINLTDAEIDALVNGVLEEMNGASVEKERESKIEKSQARLKVISRTIEKLYFDNAEGKLSDSRLETMVAKLEKEATTLESSLENLTAPSPAAEIRSNYEKFFQLAKQYSRIEVLDRDILLTFIDRIVVGPKILPDGYIKAPRKHASYQQSVTIHYKFIGSLSDHAAVPTFPVRTDSSDETIEI